MSTRPRHRPWFRDQRNEPPEHMPVEEMLRRSYVREVIGWAACVAGVLTACGMATRDWSLALAPALLSALSMVFAGSERVWRRELRGEGTDEGTQ